MQMCSCCMLSPLGTLWEGPIYEPCRIDGHPMRSFNDWTGAMIYLCPECRTIQEAERIRYKILENERNEMLRQKQKERYEEALKRVTEYNTSLIREAAKKI